MFLNSWSLGLTLAGLIILILGLLACRTAVRILRHWDPSTDTNLQIKLENEIWLVSTLVEYGLGFQILNYQIRDKKCSRCGMEIDGVDL